jgi:hypothetical protein
VSRHGYYKEIDGTAFWEPDNPSCFYGEDCPTCNRDGRYDNDDDRKPPWEYQERQAEVRD